MGPYKTDRIRQTIRGTPEDQPHGVLAQRQQVRGRNRIRRSRRSPTLRQTERGSGVTAFSRKPTPSTCHGQDKGPSRSCQGRRSIRFEAAREARSLKMEISRVYKQIIL